MVVSVIGDMKKFLKENYKYLLGICLVAICFLGYIYKDSTMQAHDIAFHLANIQNIMDHSLKPSFIMPRLAHDLGYGLYLFYPFLPHLFYGMIAQSLAVFSVPLIRSVLFTNILVSILSSFCMYALSYRLFRDKRLAFLSALIYLLFPYRLGTITVRMALNENFCGLFIPLILLGLTYLLGEHVEKKKFLLFFIIGYVGLIFSHLVLAFFFSIFLFIILLFYFEKWKNPNILISFLEGVGIVSVLVLPNIFLFIEHYGMDYLVYQDNYVTSFGLIQDHILSFKDLLVPTAHYDWTIPYYLYLPVVGCFFYSSYLAFQKSNTLLTLLSFLCFLILFVVVFEPLWKILPDFFYVIQFPWRLLLVLSVFMSLLAPICLKHLDFKKFSFATFVLLVFAFILVLKLSTRIYHYDYTTFHDVDAGLGNLQEYYPSAYLNYQDYYSEKQGIDIIGGNASISVLMNNLESNVLQFEVTDARDLVVEFPKIYYKGYVLKDENGNTVPCFSSDAGFLSATLEDGKYSLTYCGTILYLISRVVRFFVVVTLIGYFCFRMFFQNKLIKEV